MMEREMFSFAWRSRSRLQNSRILKVSAPEWLSEEAKRKEGEEERKNGEEEEMKMGRRENPNFITMNTHAGKGTHVFLSFSLFLSNFRTLFYQTILDGRTDGRFPWFRFRVFLLQRKERNEEWEREKKKKRREERREKEEEDVRRDVKQPMDRKERTEKQRRKRRIERSVVWKAWCDDRREKREERGREKPWTLEEREREF